MAIALKNMERRMQVFNLRHDIYCDAAGTCGCSEQTVTTVEESPMTGERRPRSRKRKVASSLTLLALEKCEGLHEAVLRVPEVRRAVDGGTLRVLTIPAATAIATPTVETKPPVPESKPRRDKERNKER